MAAKWDPIQYVEDDDLPVMEIGPWAQKKFKLVGKYCDIFTKGMKGKWNLIYMDLFCGPGFVRNKVSGQLMRNSALIAMSTPVPFDHYILNDFDRAAFEAMKARVDSLHPELSVQYSCADANSCVEELLAGRPTFSNSKQTLTFCFIDPFSLNLDFETIRILAKEKVDILMLHALQMDGNRNRGRYWQPDHERVARFTGNPDWRSKFADDRIPVHSFCKFLADEFDVNMKALGYRLDTKKEPISMGSRRIIYYLAFYSKHERGSEFFGKIQRGNNDQLELF